MGGRVNNAFDHAPEVADPVFDAIAGTGFGKGANAAFDWLDPQRCP